MPQYRIKSHILGLLHLLYSNPFLIYALCMPINQCKHFIFPAVTDKTVHGFSVFKKNDGWNAFYAKLRCKIRRFVYVGFADFYIRTLLAGFVKLRRQHFSRSAPVGRKIKKDQTFCFGNFRFIILHGNHCVCHIYDHDFAQAKSSFLI